MLVQLLALRDITGHCAQHSVLIHDSLAHCWAEKYVAIARLVQRELYCYCKSQLGELAAGHSSVSDGESASHDHSTSIGELK